jgi:hypothetical protein
MTKSILLAAAVALSATTASAGTVKLPEDFLGTWCVEYRDDELTSLQRTGCDATADKAVIRQNSIDFGSRCKLVRSHRSETGNAYTFVMFYRCGTGKLQNDWHVNIVMKHGDLFLNTQRGGK